MLNFYENLCCKEVDHSTSYSTNKTLNVFQHLKCKSKYLYTLWNAHFIKYSVPLNAKLVLDRR